MPMRPARYPLGRKKDLLSLEGLIPAGASEGGFLPFASAPVVYGYGTALVSEWVPDATERDALKVGGRIRVVTLTRGPVPLRVGVATGLYGDVREGVEEGCPDRLDLLARNLMAEFGTVPWDYASPEEQDRARANARTVLRLIMEALA